MFTEEQINEILAVCHKATPGPWYTEKTGANFRGFSTECIIATVGGNSKVYANPSEGHIFPADDKDFIALARTVLPQLAEEHRKLLAVAEAAKRLYEICFDMPIDFPSAGPFVWGMGDLKEALTAAGYGGEG